MQQPEKEAPRLNRAQKRQLAADLRRAMVRASMPDRVNEIRAKRRAVRREAAKVKNLNRRRNK